ncbi:MAG: methyl-accepting chemotaxis protein [Methylococcaceae bacterium]|nr:methyl-accepting chemotaxis protein [Methylococcaceae bacterium]
MFKNLKLRTSILLGFSVPIALFILSSFLVVVNVHDTEQATNLTFTSRDISQNALELELAASSIIREAQGYILTQHQANKDTMEQGDRDFLSALGKLNVLVTDQEQQARITQLQALQKDIIAIARQEVELTDQGKVQAAIDMAKTTPIMTAWTNFKVVISTFSDQQRSVLGERLARQASLLQQLRTIAWSSSLAVTVIALLLGIWIAARINNVLSGSVGTLASSSAEISATVEQHERTILQQTASVSETTATAEELRVSAQTSSDQAENAAIMVKKAMELIEEGSVSAQRSTVGMGDLQKKVQGVAEQILQLSEQAGQIGVIAKLVGDLASETNMLALNAAVEAARAGENGKGFAVVASEVRKLADQSKKSAERANALVTEIQKATNSAVMVAEEGSKTAKEVFTISTQNSETFQALAEYSGMIDQNAQQVVLNSRQQAGALSQISEAMKNLNVGSTEMMTATKQTKAGLQNLTDVATSLKAMI